MRIFFRLKTRRRLPSHVTFREVLEGVDFDEVLSAFNPWAEQYVEERMEYLRTYQSWG